MIRMHLNENFLIEREWAQKLLQEAIIGIDPREYPSMWGSEARAALASFHGIPEERIIGGNGGVAIIDLITSAFTQNSCCLVVQPTFHLYEKFYLGI